MRVFKQVTKKGKILFTVSIWGEAGHDELFEQLLEELREAYKNQKE